MLSPDQLHNLSNCRDSLESALRLVTGAGKEFEGENEGGEPSGGDFGPERVVDSGSLVKSISTRSPTQQQQQLETHILAALNALANVLASGSLTHLSEPPQMALSSTNASIRIPIPAGTLSGDGSATHLGGSVTSSLSFRSKKPSSRIDRRSPRTVNMDFLDPTSAQSEVASWASAVSEGAVDEETATWLTNNYASEYHRGTTGFEVRLRSSSVAYDLVPADATIRTVSTAGSSSAPSPILVAPPAAASATLKPKSGFDFLAADEDIPEFMIDSAKYTRTQKRSHPAFCSQRRYHTTLQQHHIPLIEEINNPDFDIFASWATHSNDVFVVVTMNILLQYNFIWSLQINITRLHQYLKVVESMYGYRNPYHNACHAADVLQTTNVYLCSSDCKENFSDVELFAVLFSALVHDVGHIGISNAFLQASRHPIARLHNDRSPLESMHLNIAFELLEMDDTNFLSDSQTFSRAHYDDFRGLVVHAVLGTDMKFHSELTASAKYILADGQIDDNEVRDLFRSIVHAADLSNPMKPQRIYLQWVDRVLAEFWQQGDEERRRGLPISSMCDRSAANVAKSQLGFINFVVRPFMVELKTILPAVWLARLDDNSKYMETLSGADESERISSISRMAEVKWVDPDESPMSYASIVYRTLQRNYTSLARTVVNPQASTVSRRRSGQSSSLTVAYSPKSKFNLSSADLVQASSLTVPPTSQPAVVRPIPESQVKSLTNSPPPQPAGIAVHLTEYSARLLAIAERINAKIRPLTQRRQARTPEPTLLGSESFSIKSSILPPPEPKQASGVSDDVMFRALSREWVTTVLQLQVELTKKLKLLGAFVDGKVQFFSRRVLERHLDTLNESVNDVAFELSQEELDGIGDDEVRCALLVRTVCQDAEAGTPKLLRHHSSISFDSVHQAAEAEHHAEDELLEALTSRLTRQWVFFFDVTRLPETAEHCQQTESAALIYPLIEPPTELTTPPLFTLSPKSGDGRKHGPTSPSIGHADSWLHPRRHVNGGSAPLVELAHEDDRSRHNSAHTNSLASVSMGLSHSEGRSPGEGAIAIAQQTWDTVSRSPGSPALPSASHVTRAYLERARPIQDRAQRLETPWLGAQAGRGGESRVRPVLPPLVSHRHSVDDNAERRGFVAFAAPQPASRTPEI